MQLLAFRFALAGNSILVVFITVVGFSITPLKLLDPLWLAAFSEVIINNTFMAVVGLSFISLSCYFDPSNTTLISHQSRLAKLCFAVILGFCLLIPLQFYLANRTVAALQRKELYQYEATSRQIKFLAQKIQQATTFDQLQAVMKAYQAFEIPESERAKPLESLKRFLVTQTNEALVLVKNRRRPDLIIAGAWQSYKSAIRNTIYSLAYILVFASFAQRSRSENSWLQELMQAFLNRLYAVLQRRETRIATEALQSDQPKTSVPPSQEQLISLHRQGLMDQAWITDHESPVVDTDLLPESPEESEQSVVTLPRRPGPFAWIRSGERRRQDDPTAFLETLAHQDSNDQAGSSDGDSLANVLPETSQPEPASQAAHQSQRRAGSMPSNRSKPTDLDYFEQLAGELDAEPEDLSPRSDHPTNKPPQPNP
ncbi:MAG: hypothetical protein ACK5N0_03005 [Synechococcaceae cyanobacterium]